ncbi:hypothetical protein ABGV42_13035 [Paenibacillus pabuli]|uniref:hypothetical protein n=1 Tax=Paenibacillus pabuli TaxID=1472 RepID=UPI003242BFC1
MDIISASGIIIRSIYEFNEPKEDVMEERDIRLVSEACKQHMERARPFEDYEAFAERGLSIMERLNNVGIQRPTQIVILGSLGE